MASQIYRLKPGPPVPPNVAIVGYRVFLVVVKQNEVSRVTSVLIRRD